MERIKVIGFEKTEPIEDLPIRIKTQEEKMEKVAICKICKRQQSWTIYKNKVKCLCGKEYNWLGEGSPKVVLLAEDIVGLVNSESR